MHRIIAFTGGMFSGKTSAIQALESALDKREVRNIKFAQPLYDIQAYVYQRISQEVPKPKDRRLLQWLGTEWGRDKDVNLWVNLWKDEAWYELESSPTSIVVCDDLRFDNEAQVVKELGGFIVRVEASKEVRAARAESLGMTLVEHASEKGISEQYVDYTLSNDSGRMLPLHCGIKALVKKLGL